MSGKLIHRHHYNPFKSRHIFYLLIPSVIFVFTLAYFNKNKSMENVASAIAVVTPKPFINIKISDTNIQTEVVDTPGSREVGLSKYDFLPEGQGMLFVFEERDLEHVNFWMRDMKFPIDIIWINDSKVVQIHENVDPQIGASVSELKYYIANQPIDYVLEVNAGYVNEHNISVGSSVEIEGF